MDEGEAVSIMQIDKHVLSVTLLKIAKGRIGTERADVLHIAKQLLVAARHSKGIERMPGAAEGRMPQRNSTECNSRRPHRDRNPSWK